MNFSEKSNKPSLFICLLMDMLGSLTYFIPLFGEWGDLLWAPISAYVFYRTFSGNTAKIGSVIAFVEEALPFIDFIPTFTLGYIYTFIKSKRIKKANLTYS